MLEIVKITFLDSIIKKYYKFVYRYKNKKKYMCNIYLFFIRNNFLCVIFLFAIKIPRNFQCMKTYGTVEGISTYTVIATNISIYYFKWHKGVGIYNRDDTKENEQNSIEKL